MGNIPVVLQDRRFLASGEFVVGPYGDSVLVNGTPHPYLDLPAQVVRLRLLNGSNSRVYRVGLQDSSTFHVIAGDGGLLNAPVPLQRLDLSNGAVSYTHLRAHETVLDLVCRLLLEKKKKKENQKRRQQIDVTRCTIQRIRQQTSLT